MATVTSYVYTKTPVNTTQLSQEISASSVVTALDHIDTIGDQLTIYFKDVLSDVDKTTLDGLVSAHTPAAPAPPAPVPVVTNQQVDDEKAALVRLKYAPVGWTYQAHCFDFACSTVGSLNANKIDGTSSGLCAIKFYDVNGAEITSGVQADLDASCVKTRITMLPNFNIELLAGSIHNLETITDNLYLNVMVAPQIPAAYGGSKVFVQNLNLKFVKDHMELKTDGRASKTINYDPVNFSNLMQFDFTHPAGHKSNHLIVMEFYKL